MPRSRAPYWALARAPRYSITFAVPLLLLYEALAFLFSGSGYAGLRNGADVLLKSLFVTLGGSYGLTVFPAVLLGAGAYVIARDIRKSGGIEPRIFAGMALESVVYAGLVGVIVGTLTARLLHALSLARLAAGPMARLDFPTQLMISLGAGIYEELLFRVLIVGALAALARRVLGWKPWPAGITATIAGALIFSAFHYVGPYGDPLELGSFTFRALAGVFFSGLYLLRGFGIAAWAHALYDVMLAAR